MGIIQKKINIIINLKNMKDEEVLKKSESNNEKGIFTIL